MRQVIVELTPHELEIAYLVAGQRAAMNAANGAQPRYGAPRGPEGDRLNLMGVRAEMCVAKEFNLYWSGSVGDYGAADVGGIIETRAVTSPGYSLILHPDDKDHQPYVLVLPTDSASRVSLFGWCFGRDGKRQEWWADPRRENRWAYFVDRRIMRDLNELRDLLPTLMG